MEDEGVTTIQISKSSRRQLGILAAAHMRSVKSEAEWMIAQAHAHLVVVQLVGEREKEKGGDGSTEADV